MAKFSVIRKDTELERVNSLPAEGDDGIVYFVIPEGRVYEWDEGWRSAALYEGSPRYNGTYSKVSYLEFAEICTDAPVDWSVGDFVIYPRTGLTYKLYDIPQPKKRSRKYEYGGAFVYSNVQFFPDTKWLEIEPFRDLVPEDNVIHFTTQASWSVWTNAEKLIDRLNAVMQSAHPGEWEFRLVDADPDDNPDLYKLLHDTWFNFTISGDSVLGGLDKLYDLCGNIGWVHTVELDDDDNPVNIITVGIPPVYAPGIGATTPVFKYGIGNGLTELRKSTTNRNELKTRLYAYGSTRNMIPRHYNNLTPAIKDAESVYIPNLMLPLRKWGTTDGEKDASKAFLEKNVALYGLRPDTVYFDGSDGSKEIYPSLEETTIGELYDVMASGATYHPDLSKHGRSVRLDEVEGVSGISDEGKRSQDGEKLYYTTDISIIAHSASHTGRFEIPLFNATTISNSGDVAIAMSKITAYITTRFSVNNLAITVTVRAGGRDVTVKGDYLATREGFFVELPDVTVKCSAGDTISATLAMDFSLADASGSLTVGVTAATIEARTTVNLGDSFVVTIPQIGFDISTRAQLGSQGIATIAIKDGMCGGRSFVVKSCAYNATLDSWDLVVYRGLDESLDLLFPNTTYPVAVGDHFVLLDIAMPDTYIGMAEEKLLVAATALLNDISSLKPFYEPVIDAKFMLDNNRTLREGMYMRLADSDMFSGTEYVLIDTIVINENESGVPTYKVTLREQKKVQYTNSQSAGSELKSLASGISTSTSSVGGITPAQAEMLSNLDSWFGKDAQGNIFVKKDANGNPRNFYSFGGVAAGGVATQGGGGSTVSWAQIQTTGTHIATITINGVSTNVYAPNGGVGTLQPLSFAGKTYDGTTAKTITASDITTILGYTPVPSFNGRTGAVSLLKSDIESVLTGEIDSHYHTILRFKDARSVNPLPYATGFGRGIEYALRQNSADGVSDGGTYHGVMTLYQWNDMSGGAAHQLAFTDNGNIHTRSGKTEWSAWSILATREWVESKGYAVASSYLSKTEASATYLSISDASGTYHPKSGSTSLNFTANTLTTAGLTVIGGILSVQGSAFVDSGALTIGSASKSSSYLYLATATARMTTAAENDTIYIEAYTANDAHGKMALCGQYVQTLTELRLVANETTVSGVIAPLTASSFNLGKTNKPWLYIFANRWYPNPNDTDHYIEYDTATGAFKVNGNIYATGQIAAGGKTSL